MSSTLDWIATVGQFASVAVIPIAIKVMDLREKRDEKRREELVKKDEEEKERARKEAEETKKMIEEIRDNVLINNESSRSTMRYMLQRRHAEYMTQKFVTSLQLDEFNKDFEIYKAQGGNGTAEKWHEEVNNLPIDDSRNPKNIYFEMLKQQQNL